MKKIKFKALHRTAFPPSDSYKYLILVDMQLAKEASSSFSFKTTQKGLFLTMHFSWANVGAAFLLSGAERQVISPMRNCLNFLKSHPASLLTF